MDWAKVFENAYIILGVILLVYSYRAYTRDLAKNNHRKRNPYDKG